MIKNRFHNLNTSNITLSGVLNTKQVSNSDEFAQLLKEAIHLSERNLLQTIPLVQLVIYKSSSELKTLLFDKGKSVSSWDEFVRVTQEASWVDFSESLNINSSATLSPAKRFNQEKSTMFKPDSETWRSRSAFIICEFHGKCAHATSES